MSDKDLAKTRDDQMKPGRPPHPANEPPGAPAEPTHKTMTDPATGEPNPNPPEPG